MTSTPSTSGNIRVAIIGAGISGIACARELLKQQQVQVEIFEKARGIGGRIATRRSLKETVHFNHGAQYFTARSESFRSVVQSLEMQGTIKRLNNEEIRVINLKSDGYELDNGSADSSRTERYVALPGNSALVKALASEIRPDQIHLQRRVQSFTRNGSQWSLQIENEQGLTQPFDYVVISAPVDQTLQLLQNSQTVETNFSSLINEASKASLQPYWALMVAFKRDKSIPFKASFVNDHRSLSWISRLVTSNEEDQLECWVVHATAKWSTENLEMELPQAQAQLYNDFLELLQKIAGAQYLTHASAPEYISCHRWRYAIPNPALQNPSRTFLMDEVNKVACCGDWCNGSRVEGAFNSGTDLSQAILQHHSSHQI